MSRLLPGALAAGALAWTATLLLAPFALSHGSPRVAAAAAVIYEAAGLVCHQRPERSFRLAGVQQPVCARCAGLYVSGALAALAALVGVRGRRAAPRHTRAWFIAAALPTALTVSLELLGVAHPPNSVRAIAALPLGAVAGWVFVRMLSADS